MVLDENMRTQTKQTRETENPDAFIWLNIRIVRVAHFFLITHVQRQLCIANRGYAIVAKQKWGDGKNKFRSTDGSIVPSLGGLGWAAMVIWAFVWLAFSKGNLVITSRFYGGKVPRKSKSGSIPMGQACMCTYKTPLRSISINSRTSTGSNVITLPKFHSTFSLLDSIVSPQLDKALASVTQGTVVSPIKVWLWESSEVTSFVNNNTRIFAEPNIEAALLSEDLLSEWITQTLRL
jgi:hypothetical protein